MNLFGLLASKDNSNMTNAKIFYAAKRKHFSECIDDGQFMVMSTNVYNIIREESNTPTFCIKDYN